MKAFLFAISLFLGWSGLVFGQAGSTAPIKEGLRVLTVGHSFHVWIGPMIVELAGLAGIKGHESGSMGFGASTVLDCWNIPNAMRSVDKTPPKQPEVNSAKKALEAGRVDVLTLSPIWMPDEGIDNFAALALRHNPKIRVTVQEFWLPNDEYKPVYPLETRKVPTVDHDATTMPELKKAQDAYLKDLSAYVTGVNQKLDKDVIVLVPVGQATQSLREKIVAGQASGIEKQSELFTDPWGHPTNVLKVLSAYCHFAVIYRQSPVGLPMPKGLEGKYRNEGLNKLLQELAWEAVIKEPLSGVKG